MTQTFEDADSIPVVCIGMSAGAVQPLQTLFRSLNPNTGMAFVIIHHLRESHPTKLPIILSRCTLMAVHLARSGTHIAPNQVYVIPSGSEITITDATLQIQPRTLRRGWSNVITLFLDSLAQSRHPGIAVILSGLDHDGAAALEAFKNHGGIVIAQAPGTADSPDMPTAAIKTGTCDYVLPPEDIAWQLEQLAISQAPLADPIV